MDEEVKTMQVSEIAKRYGLSQSAIKKAIYQGVLPARRLQPGSNWLIRPEDVEALLDANSNTGPPATGLHPEAGLVQRTNPTQREVTR